MSYTENLKDVLNQIVDSAEAEVLIVENKEVLIDGVNNKVIKPPTHEDILEIWNYLPKENGIADLDCILVRLFEKDNILSLKIDIK